MANTAILIMVNVGLVCPVICKTFYNFFKRFSGLTKSLLIWIDVVIVYNVISIAISIVNKVVE